MIKTINTQGLDICIKHDVVLQYVDAVKYELCMTYGRKENEPIFDILDRVAKKFTKAKEDREA